MAMSRELAQAARRHADAQSARIAEVPATRADWATVVTVGPRLIVLYKGTNTTVWRNANYTPVVGHRVLLIRDENDQLVAMCRVVA